MSNVQYKVISERPRRVWVRVLMATLLLGGTLVGGLFWGQHRANEAIAENEVLQASVLQLNADKQQLQSDLIDSQLVVEAQAFTATSLRKELAQTLSNNAALQEELSFFKELMAPSEALSGPQLKTAKITPTDVDGQFKVSVLVTQISANHKTISGELAVSLTGRQAGMAADSSNTEISVETVPKMISFRYFLESIYTVQVPEDFTPEHVLVAFNPRRGSTIEGRFDWQVEGG